MEAPVLREGPAGHVDEAGMLAAGSAPVGSDGGEVGDVRGDEQPVVRHRVSEQLVVGPTSGQDNAPCSENMKSGPSWESSKHDRMIDHVSQSVPRAPPGFSQSAGRPFWSAVVSHPHSPP
jgi:hypothetical protein